MKLHCGSKITNIVCLNSVFLYPQLILGSLYNDVFFWCTGALNQGETKVPRCLEKLRSLKIFMGVSWAIKDKRGHPSKHIWAGKMSQGSLVYCTPLSSGKVHPKLCPMVWVVTVLLGQIPHGLWNGSRKVSQILSSFFFLFSISIALTIPIFMSLYLSLSFSILSLVQNIHYEHRSDNLMSSLKSGTFPESCHHTCSCLLLT